MNDYTLVTQVDCLGPLIGSLVCADVVALDTETTGLNPRRDHVRLLQLATSDGCWLIDLYEVDSAHIWPYLAGKTVVCHNAQFDLCFLAALGFEPTRVVCSQLASQILYAGHWVAGEISKQTSLKECALRELGISLDKGLQASDWSGDLANEQIAYAARDVAVLLPLWAELEQSLTKEGLRDVAELEFRTVRAVAWAAYHGIGFDTQRWLCLTDEAQREAEALIPQLEAHVPESYRRTTRRPINWNSRKESLEAAKASGMCFVDTNNATLDYSPTYMAELILRWRRAFREADQQDLTRCSGVLDSLLPPDYLLLREPAINWHSTQQKAAILTELGAHLPRTPKGSPRVDDDTLAGIDHPLAALLRKYSDAVKRAERIGWLDFVEGGRIYPSWWQCGTETGRMSASKPPMQQVNRAAGHRSCFIAPPGRVLVKADYSQIELRCAAVISGDEAMLEAYRNGEDLHTATARTMLGRDFVNDEEKRRARQLAKACNFRPFVRDGRSEAWPLRSNELRCGDVRRRGCLLPPRVLQHLPWSAAMAAPSRR